MRVLPLICMASLIGSCNENRQAMDDHMERWAYISSDAEGRPLAAGVLLLPPAPLESESIDGRWEGNWIATPADQRQRERYGPHAGSGPLRGTAKSNAGVIVDLHPGVIDLNIILYVKQTGPDELSGRWEYVSDAGPTAEGPFSAKLQRGVAHAE